jgi:hypothetical protein
LGPDSPLLFAGKFAKLFEMSNGAINISRKASYLPASQQAPICGAQQRLEGWSSLCRRSGVFRWNKVLFGRAQSSSQQQGRTVWGMPSRHEKWQFWSILDHFVGDWVKIEQSVIEQTRLEMFFQIIFVFSTFELGGRPAP